MDNTKTRIKQANEDRKLRALEKKEAQTQSKLEVKATPVYDSRVNEISNKTKPQADSVKNTVLKKEPFDNNQTFDAIDIKKGKKNNLYGDVQQSRPELRGYYQ